METLKNDLKKIMSGSAGLVKGAGPLQVPSWRFPEKMAISLDIEEVLKRDMKDGAENHNLLLELIIDRLLFVLQSCLHGLEGSKGQRSSGIPLTLGSTVKQLSKCVIQNSSHMSDLKNKLSSQNKTITDLQSSYYELQREYKLLQDRFQISLEVKDASPGIRSSEDTRGGVMEISGAAGEAEGTELRFDTRTFTSTVQEMISVWTQTTDTAFALCARCSATQQTLADAAHLVTSMCEKHKLESNFSSCDWVALAKLGGMELSKWTKALQKSLEALDKNTCHLQDKIEGLASERDLLQEIVQESQALKSQMTDQVNSLKVELEETQLSNEVRLTKCKKEFAATKTSLEGVRSKNTKLKDELNSSKQQVATLNAKVSEVAHSSEAAIRKLKFELQAVKEHELELKAVQKSLEEQLESVIVQSHEVLTDEQVELNKSKLYNQTLERKLETLKRKQSLLLTQMDELEKECSDLREELAYVETSREKLIEELQEVSDKYSQVQKQLSTEQKSLAESTQKQQQLSAELATLQVQLTDSKEQLHTERKNSRLLLDYPFVKQTVPDYRTHVKSLLQSNQSRKQISANTIRILLLEEQNNELRHKAALEANKLRHENLDSKLNQPISLWDDQLVSKLQSEQDDAMRTSAEKSPEMINAWMKTPHESKLKNKSYEVTPYQELVPECEAIPNEKLRASMHGFRRIPKLELSSAHCQQNLLSKDISSSNSKLKGRLGHLVAAIADSQRNIPSSVNSQNLNLRCSSMDDIEVHVCDKCDKMFYQEELIDHNLSCDRLNNII